MDTMLQFSILGQNTRELYLPTRLQRAIINTKKHKQIVEALSEGEGEFSYFICWSDIENCKIRFACNLKHLEDNQIRV